MLFNSIWKVCQKKRWIDPQDVSSCLLKIEHKTHRKKSAVPSYLFIWMRYFSRGEDKPVWIFPFHCHLCDFLGWILSIILDAFSLILITLEVQVLQHTEFKQINTAQEGVLLEKTRQCTLSLVCKRKNTINFKWVTHGSGCYDREMTEFYKHAIKLRAAHIH